MIGKDEKTIFEIEEAIGAGDFKRLEGLLDGEDVAKGLDNFVAPPISKNKQGFWTNGKYRLDVDGQTPHTKGKYIEGKSEFKYGLNADKAVLDAAAYADEAGIWIGNKAKVYVKDGIIGYSNGKPTQWLNIYRTDNGMVHGAPTITPGKVK